MLNVKCANMSMGCSLFVTEGTEVIYASSTKNKLNTTSLTETKMVSVGKKLQNISGSVTLEWLRIPPIK